MADNIDRFVQERRNSSALVIEWRFSFTKASIWSILVILLRFEGVYVLSQCGGMHSDVYSERNQPWHTQFHHIIHWKWHRRAFITFNIFHQITESLGFENWACFCLLLGVSSGYAQPITGQVTEVTCPVIGQAQPELTPSKRRKTGPDVLEPQAPLTPSNWSALYRGRGSPGMSWILLVSRYSTVRSGTLTWHYDDVTMSAMAYQITSLAIVYSTVYSDPDQRKHQSSTSLAFVQGIHRGPVNSPHKWPVTRKMSPFDDVIMAWLRPVLRTVFRLLFTHILCKGARQLRW